MRKICFALLISLLSIACAEKQTVRKNMNFLAYILSDYMFYQFESEGCRLNIDIELADSVQFLSDIGQLPKFVFFHTQLNCNVCVEGIMTVLNDYQNILCPKNRLFFAAYNNKRDVTLFKRMNHLNNIVYNVKSVGLPIEKLNLPFCFVMDKDMKAECVYIPLEGDSLLFKKYLKLVNEKYFKEE
jgi:hypothetical protein